MSVGFAFSLGHSSVVILAGVLVVAACRWWASSWQDGTTGNLVLGLIGSGVSGLFLLAMGLFNGSAFVRAAQGVPEGAGRRRIAPADLAAEGIRGPAAGQTVGPGPAAAEHLRDRVPLRAGF